MIDVTPEQWKRIEELFESAAKLDRDEQSSFLAGACPEQPALRAEVESLLATNRRAHRFLETPAVGVGHIGPYRLIRVIASGGMGVVYEAEQQNPRRSVALKVVRGGQNVDEQRIKLFQREVDSLARLKHPGIASIYESGCTDGGQHYFAMELVRGQALNEYARKQKMSVRQRLELFCRLCEAISFAHQRGVIHRDLKPSNILVSGSAPSRGRGGSRSNGTTVKVLDFGLARVTDAEAGSNTTITGVGQIMGTLRYMSPEQARGLPDEIDVRSDVFSLGVVLYELLTDRLPHEFGESPPHAAIRIICERAPIAPGAVNRALRGDIETIVLKSLQKEPKQRYQSVDAMAEDVARFLSGQPILAHPPSSLYQFRKLVARHKVLVGFLATIIIFGVAFGVMAWIDAARLKELAGHLEVERRTAVVARDNETRARKVSERIASFLQDMLASADPQMSQGRGLTVREVLDEAGRRVDAELADQPVVAAAVRDTIGRTYHSLGLHKSAESHLRAALDTRQALFGRANPDVVSSLNHLASLLIDAGDYEEAESLASQALDDARDLFEQDHPLIASAMNILGRLKQARGNYGEAETYYRSTLDMRRRLFGDQHRDVATSLNNLATLHHAMGDYNTAETLHRDALRTRRALLGSEHPDVAASLNNLAMSLWQMGAYAEAEPLFVEVLSLQKKLVGESHPLVAATLNNFALMLKVKGELDRAESMFREALAVQREVLSPDHPDIAETLNNLGALLYAKREFEAAELTLREALHVRKAALGESHPKLAKNLSDLAAVLFARRDLDGAEGLYREALAMNRNLEAGEHPYMGGILNNLASLTYAKGEYVEAGRLYREAVDILTEILGADHPHLAAPNIGLGKCLMRQGFAAEAESPLRKGFDLRRNALPSGHRMTADAEGHLGACLVALGRFDEAETLLLDSCTAMSRKVSADDPRTIESLQRLVALYDAWDKPDCRAEYSTRLSAALESASSQSP